MQFNEKRLFPRLGGIYALIHLFLYLPVHISYQEFFAEAPTSVMVTLGIFISVLSEIANFALPLIAATVLFLSYAYKSLSHALPRVFVFSLPYAVSALPENYLKYLAYSDSGGSIAISAVITLITVLTVSVQILALFGIICFFCRLPRERRTESEELAELARDRMLDFSAPFSKGLLAAALVSFLVRFLAEAFSTVSYIIDNNGAYRVKEILTIVFTFVFIAALFVASYIFTYKIKARLLKTGPEKASGKAENKK